MIVLKIIFGIIILILIWHFTTRKYINPYKLVFYFGKKGSGKSTLLSKIAYENLKKGKMVYTQDVLSFPIRTKAFHKKVILSTIQFDPIHIYDYSFPSGSVILIDEASILPGWSNRDFKNSDKRLIAWFQQQRKYKVTVHLFSVSFDIDKKIRDLCDEMFIVQKFARVLSIARHVVRKPIIVHPMGDSPASIQDDIIEDGLLLAPFGGMRVTLIPKWTKYFDSFAEVVKVLTESP